VRDNNLKKIILLTNMSSIKKHWENAIVGIYSSLHVENTLELFTYLKSNTSHITILLDELSVNNIEVTLQGLNKFKNIDVLLFNSVPEVHHASLLIGGIVKGYENSYLNKHNLLMMLENIENGKIWLFTDLTNYIINKYISTGEQKEPTFLKLLTPKEKDIALMIADGLTNKEIVKATKSALSTVKGHISKIFEKADVSDRVSLVLKLK